MSCCCFKLTITPIVGVQEVYYPEDTGRTYDGTCVYSFDWQSTTWNIWRDPVNGWFITRTLEGEPTLSGDTFAGAEQELADCPIDANFILNNWVPFIPYNEWVTSISTEEYCCPIQERVYAEFQEIKLPTPPATVDFAEPFECCDEKLLVLAHPTDTEGYKNDVTSAWIKLSAISDTITFVLKENGVDTGYGLQEMAFPNQANAYYTTVDWKDVLNTLGIGCYQIELQYSIGGIVGTLIWGTYDLKEYSLATAKGTARLQAKFNLKQQIEGIDFTNANVVDTIRFYGFIGDRQPNMEVDNLIYSDRILRSVVRENLNTWIIKTDPYTERVITLLTDLYLLSENELFISDYNSFNHSHKILDIPVIVQESPEIDYLENYQRKAILTCTVGDKQQNKRTYY